MEEALAARDARCVAVLVTHHHGDHAEAALPWGRRFGAPVAAASGAVAGPGGRLLEPGERLTLAGTAVDVVPTPGHTADHLAFRLESGAVLVGDHVLGRGTSVVTHPEGDVVAYLESLRRVHALGPAALYCGHGPELTEDPGAVLDFYLAHRAYREQQLLAALAAGAGDRRRAGRRRLRGGAPSPVAGRRAVHPRHARQAARRGAGRRRRRDGASGPVRLAVTGGQAGGGRFGRERLGRCGLGGGGLRAAASGGGSAGGGSAAVPAPAAGSAGWAGGGRGAGGRGGGGGGGGSMSRMPAGGKGTAPVP